MKKVNAAQVASPDQAMRGDLSEAVQLALGDLAGAARSCAAASATSSAGRAAT